MILCYFFFKSIDSNKTKYYVLLLLHTPSTSDSADCCEMEVLTYIYSLPALDLLSINHFAPQFLLPVLSEDYKVIQTLYYISKTNLLAP